MGSPVLLRNLKEGVLGRVTAAWAVEASTRYLSAPVQSHCTSPPSAPSFSSLWFLPVPHAPDFARSYFKFAGFKRAGTITTTKNQSPGQTSDYCQEPGACSEVSLEENSKVRDDERRAPLPSEAAARTHISPAFLQEPGEKAQTTRDKAAHFRRKGGTGVTRAPGCVPSSKTPLATPPNPSWAEPAVSNPGNRAGAEAAGDRARLRMEKKIPAVAPRGSNTAGTAG